MSDGHLHAQYGTQHQANSFTYEGTIQPDGRVTISANGLTGDATYNVHMVQRGVPYGYQFTAQSKGTHGRGRRREARPCDVDFVRQ